MAEDSDLERTEPATAKRLGLAREDGNIPRSRELTTFAITMAGVALLMAQGGHIATNLAQTMRVLLTFDQTTVRDAEPALIRFKETIFNALWSLAPLLAGLALVALFVPMLVGGWNLTFKAIEPKFSKLNPFPASSACSRSTPPPRP